MNFNNDVFFKSVTNILSSLSRLMRPQYPDTFFLLEFPGFFTDRLRIFWPHKFISLVYDRGNYLMRYWGKYFYNKKGRFFFFSFLFFFAWFVLSFPYFTLFPTWGWGGWVTRFYPLPPQDKILCSPLDMIFDHSYSSIFQ